MGATGERDRGSYGISEERRLRRRLPRRVQRLGCGQFPGPTPRDIWVCSPANYSRGVRKVDRGNFSEYESSIPQYSVQYLDLSDFPGPVRVKFQGQAENSLLPTDAGSQGCWWSNSGDSINSTLTAHSGLEEVRPTPLFPMKYGTTSRMAGTLLTWRPRWDGGAKWSILDAPGTTAKDPFGKNFGVGYTGKSMGWIAESVDLGEFAGEQVLLRFQYVTDDAVNAPGLCLRQAALTSSRTSAAHRRLATAGIRPHQQQGPSGLHRSGDRSVCRTPRDDRCLGWKQRGQVYSRTARRPGAVGGCGGGAGPEDPPKGRLYSVL